MGYSELLDLMGRVNDVLNAKSVLSWDARTKMPNGGAATRAKQEATLIVLAHGMLLDRQTRQLLDAAEREVAGRADDSPEKVIVAQVREALEYHARFPAALLQRRTELASSGRGVWARARTDSDFAHFAPVMQETVDLNREIAEAIGYDEHPYDALMYRFEPHQTVKNLDALFARLREAMIPLVRAVMERPAPRTDFLERDYPPDEQMAFARIMAETVGYDFERGRLDTTVHPFEVSFTRNDVRITSRFSRNYLPAGLFGTLHESGHGLYEQGIDPAYTRTPLATDLVGLYAVGGVSYGAHESQSRLWENHVGRARAFWDIHFAKAQAAFPTQLGDVTPEEFWRAVNRCKPNLIRVESDELTYDFHIMLRCELEKDLVEGTLAVNDLPEAWNAKIKDYLGLDVPNDRLGVLQDVHWSAGQIGSFCNYTIGNVMAGQLYAEASKDPAIAAGIASGDYTALRSYMVDNIHRHGRRYSRNELLVRTTGRPLDPEPYIAHLTKKYSELYDLTSL